ncbi:hypothetical protein RhiirA5_430321 [Rhizophagus irregularis]|uniref:Uncharacterized protein n=3 Tax=Rhizophagus irregularis TaxID=588596 RepID=A0A2I1EMQ9_9GLOM|nr:hypothetical protein GLOIN_2v1782557 [Rhizophagus irregularis DAOM 181602=DAOM 197198]EXX68534.1 hypothetical protein RirG_104290 [Rhizophagus irregularis DAOM 197198w]PKB99076.1 hypothetical protein RhiirA5_430321 [Rhizophagus irregularis]PKC66121.1 hypothetical protein RhiirA1_460132 [Rhizophagus irregularis]PKY23372.1 hypothetical protein RhiirB3_437565 [Rhizophagus irregularis]PKY41308.1 hypothetical protein RhiirA4_454857 [Rhizophagus irregularis]|eukprot:XP_025171561.1 hypothetical protein GLOIN_2v1782557 [Rhizophagus irregularis DAOM 181602=DAOM 197198]
MTTRENKNKSSQIGTEFKPIPILPNYSIPQTITSKYRIQEQQFNSTSLNNFNIINQNLPYINNQPRFFLESNNTYDYYRYQTKNLLDTNTNDDQSQQSLIQENIQLKAKLAQEFHNSQQLQVDINEIEYLHNRLKLLINQLKGRIASLEEQNFCLKTENELLNANLKMSEESRIQLMKQLQNPNKQMYNH